MTIIEKIAKLQDNRPLIFLCSTVDFTELRDDHLGRYIKIGIHYLTYADFIPAGEIASVELCTDILNGMK